MSDPWPQTRSRRRWAAVALAVALAAVACASDDDASSGAAEDPAALTSSEATSPETDPAETLAQDPGPTSTTAEAQAAPFGTGLVEVTLVDDSRPTPPSGDQPGRDDRTLRTVVVYPTAEPGDGPVADAEPAAGSYPLVVFAHGLGAAPEDYLDIVTRIAQAGHVVAAPAFPLTGSSNPDGPDAGDTGAQPGDLSFLIGSLTDPGLVEDVPATVQIDPERIAVAGHSNGAITTLGISANSCCVDDRVDAAVVLAGTPAPFDGAYDFATTPPMLLIHGTADTLIPYEASVGIFNDLTAVKGLLTLREADHGQWLGAGSPLFEDVAATTLDFLAHTLDSDAAAADRLGQPRADDSAELVFAPQPGSELTVEVESVDLDRDASVDPTIDLVDGQLVTVSWSGFLPGRVVNVVQCSQGGTGGNDVCDLTNGQILQPNPTGEGSLELEVIAGAVGTGVCDGANDDCVIVVNDAGLPDPDATIRIPISFAP